MAISLGLVVLGLALLICGGELLLRGAVNLATLARMTPAVIGLTVVAAGTSVPELAVSILAAWRGSEGVAVGNVVGSNIFNIALILGVAALIRPLTIAGNTIRLEYPALALATGLCVVVMNDGTISRLDGVLFLAAYVGFTLYLVTLVRRQINQTEAQELQAEVAELSQPQATPPRAKLSISLGFVVAGIGFLAAGAHATVTGAIEVGRFLGLSETVIGLTIIAGGTGLPEVVTSLVSSIRGRDDIAIGNVIGSNLFNILTILGLSGLVHPLQAPPEILRSDIWWMLGITLVLGPLLFTGRRISRWEGLLLLGAYGLYLGLLLSQAA